MGKKSSQAAAEGAPPVSDLVDDAGVSPSRGGGLAGAIRLLAHHLADSQEQQKALPGELKAALSAVPAELKTALSSIVEELRDKKALEQPDALESAIKAEYPLWKGVSNCSGLTDPRVTKDPLMWIVWCSSDETIRVSDIIMGGKLPGPTSELMLRLFLRLWKQEKHGSRALDELQELFMHIVVTTLMQPELQSHDQLLFLLRHSIDRARDIILDLDTAIIRKVKGRRAAQTFRDASGALDPAQFPEHYQENVKRAGRSARVGSRDSSRSRSRSRSRTPPRKSQRTEDGGSKPCRRCKKMIGPQGFKEHNKVCEKKKR
jgi:hypothetical protein